MSQPFHRVIETSRLLLRPHELSDYSDICTMWADPAVVRHIYEKVQTDAESWFRLLRYRGHWELLGYGYWAVTDKNDSTFLGEVGFADYRREIEPSFNGMPEAGWVMKARTHGRGMAREAVTAAMAWMDENTAARRTVAMISPENESSLRLADALGYKKTRNSLYNGFDREIWERDHAN